MAAVGWSGPRAALLLYALSGLLLGPCFMGRASRRTLAGANMRADHRNHYLGHRCVCDPGRAVYLQALGLSKNQLVQALGLSFSVSTLALAAGLYWRGNLGGGELNASLLALLPAMLGMWLGQWLRRRISATLFKRVFFIGMALLGVHLLIGG